MEPPCLENILARFTDPRCTNPWLTSSAAYAANEPLRFGYQKSSTLITLLEHQGSLEKASADQGVSAIWHEFPNGQPLLEALNVGNIDLSSVVAAAEKCSDVQLVDISSNDEYQGKFFAP